MTIGEKIGGIKLPFVAKHEPEHDEKLVQLFKNRADLKKAHGALQDEIHQLRDRLKQQEGATQRAQEQLEALEIRLGDPEAGFDSLAFFQLRGLWRACHRQLEQFVGELSRQQEERERLAHVAAFSKDKNARLAAAELRVREFDPMVEEARATLEALEARYRSLRGFWNYFRRRRLAEQVAAQRSRTDMWLREQGEFANARDAVAEEQTPGYNGLGIDGRRAINLAAIAYAQAMCARLGTIGLTLLVKAAVDGRVADADYGSHEEIAALMDRVAHAAAAVDRQRDWAPEIKVRVDRLRQKAEYRADNDTVPLSESAMIGPIARAGQPVSAAPEVNVLADDYWELYRVLLR
jgi:phage shock protein A